MCDKPSPRSSPSGMIDTWKGNNRGRRARVKTVRHHVHSREKDARRGPSSVSISRVARRSRSIKERRGLGLFSRK